MMMTAAIGGGAVQGLGALASYQSARGEAQILKDQSLATATQTARAEEATRRQSAEFLSKQSAAIGESGIGFGGSSADLIRQSAIDAELDALNVRYEGMSRARGLMTQSRLTKKAAKTNLMLGLLGAATDTGGGIGRAKHYEAVSKL